VAKSGEVLRAEGTVVETLRDAGFRVRLADDGEVNARAAGRMRRRQRIRFIPGDRVDLEISIYHPTKGSDRVGGTSSGQPVRTQPVPRDEPPGRSGYGSLPPRPGSW
jgi:translation initiation factor IF-1